MLSFLSDYEGLRGGRCYRWRKLSPRRWDGHPWVRDQLETRGVWQGQGRFVWPRCVRFSEPTHICHRWMKWKSDELRLILIFPQPNSFPVFQFIRYSVIFFFKTLCKSTALYFVYIFLRTQLYYCTDICFRREWIPSKTACSSTFTVLHVDIHFFPLGVR